jgi:hypothetical protein
VAGTTTDQFMTTGQAMTTATAADTGARLDRLVGVTLVRAGAAVLIMHGFLVGLWMQRHGENPGWLAGIREWVNRPLRIGEDFGPLGVMLLVLASGFLAGAAADRASPGASFGVGRLIRTYLPVPVATVLTAGVLLAGAQAWTSPADAEPTGPNVLGNLTLLSHLVPARTLLVPLAWVIGIQLLCWVAALAARRVTWPVALALPAAAVALAALGGGAAEHVALPLCVLPLAVVGLLAWKVTSGALAPWAGVLLGSVSVAAVVAVERSQPVLADWWYPVAAGYALLLFLAAVMVSGPTAAAIARHPATSWLAGRAEWLLVLLGAVGHPVLWLLHQRVPLAVAAGAAVIATCVAADACHRLTGRLGEPR